MSEMVIYQNRNFAGQEILSPAETAADRVAALKRAGLYALLEQESSTITTGFPLLSDDEFRDVVEVFQTSYLSNDANHSIEKYEKKFGIEDLLGGINLSPAWGRMKFVPLALYKHHESIPTEVALLMPTLFKNKTFKALEIRTPEYENQTAMFDPLLLGISRTGARSLIARWGSERLITSEEIKFLADARRDLLGNKWGMWESISQHFRLKDFRKRFPQYAGYMGGRVITAAR